MRMCLCRSRLTHEYFVLRTFYGKPQKLVKYESCAKCVIRRYYRLKHERVEVPGITFAYENFYVPGSLKRIEV